MFEHDRNLYITNLCNFWSVLFCKENTFLFRDYRFNIMICGISPPRHPFDEPFPHFPTKQHRQALGPYSNQLFWLACAHPRALRSISRYLKSFLAKGRRSRALSCCCDWAAALSPCPPRLNRHTASQRGLKREDALQTNDRSPEDTRQCSLWSSLKLCCQLRYFSPTGKAANVASRWLPSVQALMQS